MEEATVAGWAERLQPLLGYTARLSVGRTAPDVWTGLEAVEIEVEALWTVGEIAAEGDELVVRAAAGGGGAGEALRPLGEGRARGTHGPGEAREVRVPVAQAFMGLDAAGEFFLAGWPEGDGRFRYLRISREDAGSAPPARPRPLPGRGPVGDGRA
ncbi:MAG: hypothetical protein IMW98_02270 [Firmicutes bacterium]|nr:hypothetical protein [Bacillota bacterium]